MTTWEQDILMQKTAVSLLEYACNGSKGRPHLGDPVYEAVTERRQINAPKYSSCGDLAHWLLYRLGVRLSLVNRKEHLGWKQGLNVSRLAFSKLTLSVTDQSSFQPGDIIIIWNRPDTTDAHVVCVIDEREDSLLTAEYGQPGGALRTRSLMRHNGGLILGNRKIHKHLPLLSVLAAGDLEPIDNPRQP
jgi:hypothetical protein